MINIKTIADILLEKDNILILAHRTPDGDTIGASYALYDVLSSLGKTARIECADKFDERFNFITKGIEFKKFEPSYIIAVDVAAHSLLGTKSEEYPHVDMCIDHHETRTRFADIVYTDGKASAACEIVFEIIKELIGDITYKQALALYTGIATDTGCFKFPNVTVRTHQIVAELMTKGINCGEINEKVFCKTKSRALLEATLVSNAIFLCDNKVMIQTLTKELRDELGASDDDVHSIAGAPQTIDGVLLGITIRYDGKNCRLSVRTDSPLSASDFCSQFNGGGHDRAAGCKIDNTLENVLPIIIKKAEKAINSMNT